MLERTKETILFSATLFFPVYVEESEELEHSKRSNEEVRHFIYSRRSNSELLSSNYYWHKGLDMTRNTEI